MKFDLEIPGASVDIVYIPEGSPIPTGVVPLEYVHMDHKDYLPRSFMSMEENVLIEEFAGLTADQHNGPSFIAKGNRFNLTHIAKYAPVQNVKVPLFFKHVIYNKKDERINEDTIRIVDFEGILLSEEKFVIEQVLDTVSESYRTTVYMNKEPGIWFIEYVSKNKTNKKLLNLQRIFTEIGWESTVFYNEDIPAFAYSFQGNSVNTSYSGILWVEYEHEKRPIHLPIANIYDNWNIGILNAEWTYYDEAQGISFDYSIPEYYLQNSSESSKFKKYIDKKCEILFESFVKTQSEIDLGRWNQIDVVIRNFFTNEVKAAFTTNEDRVGHTYSSDTTAVYGRIEDYNAEGIIKLPYKITSTDVVYASWPYIESYYNFRFFNFNSDVMNSGGHVAIYVLPNRGEGEFSVMYAMIGERENSAYKDNGTQGLIFEKTQDYYDFISYNNCYHLAIIKVSARQEANIVNFIDVRSVGGVLTDKKRACELTKDTLLKDIIDGVITIPTNDTVISFVQAKDFEKRKLISYDKKANDINNNAYRFLIDMHKKAAMNLDLSTNLILALELPSSTEYS